MSTKVAVITGANKGIGFSIVEGLCKKFNGVVYLTGRDEARGLAAIKKLNSIGPTPEFHQLDVSNKDSVTRFRDFIKQNHGGIDILINNAAILDMENLYPSYEEAKNVIDINYKSLLTVEEHIYPLLRYNARVVNISSDCGHITNIRNKKWLDTLLKKDLTVDELNEIVDSYLSSLKKGFFKHSDFADNGVHAEYRMSKVALTALTKIQQRKYAERNISINAVHPGFVKTDMTNGQGQFTQEQGAETPLYLALDAPKDVKGCYVWFDKTLVDWYDLTSDKYYCKWGQGN